MSEVQNQKRRIFNEFLSNDLKRNLLGGLGTGLVFSLVSRRPMQSVLFFSGVGAGSSFNVLADKFNQIQKVEHHVVLSLEQDDKQTYS